MRHRLRSRLNLSPLQLKARREKDKAELKVEILFMGVHKRLENFYGDADEYKDLLDLIVHDIGEAVYQLKQAETYYLKVTARKPRVIKKGKVK